MHSPHGVTPLGSLHRCALIVEPPPRQDDAYVRKANMRSHLLSDDFFGFYRQCLNPATDKLSIPAQSVEVGVCADHRASQRLILTQHFDADVVVEPGKWPWKDDRCTAFGFVTVGPSHLGDGTLSCPNGHTGPFDVGAHGTAEYYQIDRIDDHTITVGGPSEAAKPAWTAPSSSHATPAVGLSQSPET